MAKTSEKLGYKIAMWALLGFAVLFLAAGGIFMLSGGTAAAAPNRIYLSGSNSAVGADGEYYMSVYERQTAVMASTSPLGSSKRLTFQVVEGEDCLDITPSVWPGESAVITLKGDSGIAFKFGGTARIFVKTKNGQQSAYLNVKICLPPHALASEFVLRYYPSFSQVYSGTISAQYYNYEVYEGEHGQYNSLNPRNSSAYIMDCTVTAFGAKIAGVTFTAAAQDANYADIKLFGKAGFTGIFVPQEFLSGKNDIVVRFMVVAEHESFGEYVDFFDLYIIK